MTLDSMAYTNRQKFIHTHDMHIGNGTIVNTRLNIVICTVSHRHTMLDAS